jgi:hypothetical protein
VNVLALLKDEYDHDASTRAWNALMLSPTPQAWGQLLRGNPVPVDQLDLTFLARIRSRRL